jgi:hypothetical protein
MLQIRRLLLHWQLSLACALVLLSSVLSLTPPTQVAAEPAPEMPDVSPALPSGSTHALPSLSHSLVSVQPVALMPANQAVPSHALVETIALQEIADQATLETVQPTVEWSPAGAFRWQTIPTRQTVQTGDRVRTGPGAAARLIYSDGSVSELGPETGVLVQRLERSPSGGIIITLFQAVGTAVHQVLQFVAPASTFEVETPAGTVRVRGTTFRMQAVRDGRTRVENLPDGTGGTVEVQGNDPARTLVILRPGEGTQVIPRQAPTQPRPIGQLGTQEPGQDDEQQAQQQQQVQLQQQVIAAGQVAQLNATQAAVARAQQVGQTARWWQLVNSFLSSLTAAANVGRPATSRPGIAASASAPTASLTGNAGRPGASTPGIIAPSPTPAATATPTLAAIATPTSTPTRAATATPTATPPPLPNPCMLPSARCHAFLAPPSGATAGGPIELGPCPTPRPDNCADLNSTAAGFTLGVEIPAVITGALVDIPVVGASGAPQGSRTVFCPQTGNTGRSVCNATVPEVFPELGGTVVLRRL